jgi:hypothetical protein
VAAHRSQLERAFQQAVADLDALGARYAVIGGLAVGILVEPRTTRDVDFLVAAQDDAAAEALIFGLRQRGYEIEAVFQRKDGALSTVRTSPHAFPSVLVDLLFDSTRIEARIVERGVRREVFPGVEALVVSATDLLAMKVKAGRPKDQADVAALLPTLRPRDLRAVEKVLIQMQRGGVAQGRNLVAELRAQVRRAAFEVVLEMPPRS